MTAISEQNDHQLTRTNTLTGTSDILIRLQQQVVVLQSASMARRLAALTSATARRQAGLLAQQTENY